MKSKLLCFGLSAVAAASLFHTPALAVSIPVSTEQNYALLNIAPSRRLALSEPQRLVYDALLPQMQTATTPELSISISGVSTSVDAAAAVQALSLDFPELFAWVDRSTEPSITLTASGSGVLMTIRFEPLRSANGIGGTLNLSRIQQARQLADSIIVQGSLLSDDAARVRFYHDTLCQLSSFDIVTVTQARADGSAGQTDVFGMTGVFLDGKGSAEGYALAMKYLCDHSLTPIPCLYVEGELTASAQTPSGAHAWNYVQLNGAWYLLDTINDDVNGSNAPTSPRFFCIGTSNPDFQSYRPSSDILNVLPFHSTDWSADAAAETDTSHSAKEPDLDELIRNLQAEAAGDISDIIPEEPVEEGPTETLEVPRRKNPTFPQTLDELDAIAQNGVAHLSLSGTASLPGKTLEVLSASPSRSLELSLDGSVSLLFAGGSSLRTTPAASYDITYRSTAPSASLIRNYVSGGRYRTTFSIGQAALLPMRMTVTVSVSIPDGTDLDVYRFESGAFTPIDTVSVKNGQVSFRTTMLGEYLLTDGTV